MKGFAFTFGGIFTIIAILILFGLLIFKIVDAGQQCAISTGKDCMPLLVTLGNATLAPSAEISDAINGLKAVEGQETEFAEDYRNYLRQQIFASFLMIFIMIYLIYRFIKLFVKTTSFDLGTQLFVFIAVIIILIFIQFAYAMIVLKQTIIPFKGLWDLATNFNLLT